MKCSVVDTKTGRTMKTFSTLKAAHKFQDQCIKEYGRPTFAIDFAKKANDLKIKQKKS